MNYRSAFLSRKIYVIARESLEDVTLLILSISMLRKVEDGVVEDVQRTCCTLNCSIKIGDRIFNEVVVILILTLSNRLCNRIRSLHFRAKFGCVRLWGR